MDMPRYLWYVVIGGVGMHLTPANFCTKGLVTLKENKHSP